MVFQFVKILHLSEVYHFHDMIDMLVKCGYKKGATLFGYGYDFRQSNRYNFFNWLCFWWLKLFSSLCDSILPKCISSKSEKLEYFIVGRIDKLMEGLKGKLETTYEASGCRKVNIISHSMGGLLVSCFMSLHKDVRILSLGD